jgi:hypothetical protein
LARNRSELTGTYSSDLMRNEDSPCVCFMSYTKRETARR